MLVCHAVGQAGLHHDRCLLPLASDRSATSKREQLEERGIIGGRAAGR